MVAVYRFADTVVRVESCYAQVHDYCRDYVWAGEPDFALSITHEDIRREGERCAQPIPAEFLEISALLRKLAEALVARHILLLHGSAIAFDGEGYLFTAKSGTGKSTHARLWREVFGERTFMVNDDKPFLKITEEGAFVCGSPWDGKQRLSRNTMVPLKAICFLRQGAENEIHPISPQQALPGLLEQCYRPATQDAFLDSLTLLDRLSGCVRFYALSCNMDPEAAEIACKAMAGGE